MIVKHFELKKKILPDKKFFLLYGNNDGFIKEIIQKNLKPILPNKIFNYEEAEILNNIDNFKEDVLNKSFFENEKLIIISRTTDKIYKIVEDFIEKNVEFLENNPDYSCSSSKFWFQNEKEKIYSHNLNQDLYKRIKNFFPIRFVSHNIFFSLARRDILLNTVDRSKDYLANL